MNRIYLLAGGNMGDRDGNLAVARKEIGKHIGIIELASSIYETASWGNISQPSFLNQALLVKSDLSADEVLSKILSIEHRMGRIRTTKNASRIIDIDILFFNDAVINTPGLVVPHPEIQNRRFALVPMAEIAPSLVHPLLHQTINSLLSTSKDTLEVKRVG